MSVRKRCLPSGEIRWQVDYKDGAGVRRHRQFETKRDADAFNVKARSEVAAGIHTAESASITVEQAADLWIDRCEKDGLEAATVLEYRQHVKLHIKPFIGATKLTRLTVPAVNAFRDQLLDADRSHDMVRRAMKSLAAIVGEAQGRGLVAVNNVRMANPTKRIKRRAKREANRRPVMPPKEELRSIIEHTPEQHLPLILTAIFAGLRGSELRGLMWEDIDVKHGKINVTRRADRYNRIGLTKSDSGTRTIPLSPLLFNTLKVWKLKCPKGELGLVFPNGAGNVENHSNLLWRVFWPIQIAAGVTVMRDGKDEHGNPIKVPDAKYSLHALRHAAAALWIEQGFGPKRIQELMGHSTIATTFDLYGYLFASDEADTESMAQVAARLVD